MFDNYTGVHFYKYEVVLDEILSAICTMALDIGIQIEGLPSEARNIEYALKLFKNDFLDLVGVEKNLFLEKEENGEFKFNYDSLFSKISIYYNQNIFKFENVQSYLNKSDVAFIEPDINVIWSFNSELKILNNAIKNVDVIQSLITNLEEEKVRLSLKEINKFNHFALYTKVITLTPVSVKPELRTIPYILLDDTTFRRDASGTDNIWINIATYKNRYKIELKPEDGLEYLFDDEIKLGLKIGDVVIPFVSDLTKYVLKESAFEYWYLVFKDNLGKPVTKHRESSQLLTDFLSVRQESTLNKLLSNLKKNLYVDSSVEIPEPYLKFFRKFAYVEKLNYLQEYELYMPQAAVDSALGIYTTEKKKKNYNLLHWLEHEDEKRFKYFPGPKSESKKKELVSILKPEVSFYLLEKYFEDILEEILKKKEYQFISNLEVTVKGQAKFEIDFLINNNSKLYFIEAKTKLTRDYIYDYLDSAALILNAFKMRFGGHFDMEFLLLAGFSDENVKNYQHFVDLHPKENYNVPRIDLNTIPYYFKVPIPNVPGKDILCIAEPEYGNMETIISEICPK